MPFTAEDCKRLTGTDRPAYYTTPADWRACKNLNLAGPTPCWHPHCDCMGEPPRRKRRYRWMLELMAALVIAYLIIEFVAPMIIFGVFF